MSFNQHIQSLNWNDTLTSIQNKSEQDVMKALNKQTVNLEDFKALISPAARPHLELLAQKSRSITQKRFGKTIMMYIPMYLSNECQNICTYCGFSMENKVPRITLTNQQIHAEAKAIKAKGFDHILLLTGEANKTVGVEYIKNAIRLVRPYFSNISIEVQPLKEDEYSSLLDEGLHTVLVYQETYRKETYKIHHPKGRKSNYEWRLETPERLGRAGAFKIGLGVLLGLEDWRTDSFMTAFHLDYLQKHFWKSKYSISFPRLRPCEGYEHSNKIMDDRDLVQLICAYRIFNPDLELSLSTRESPSFRDHAIQLGITSISAESKTEPGGYASETNALEQFEIDDHRSTEAIAGMIRNQGYEPVWKDWDKSYQ